MKKGCILKKFFAIIFIIAVNFFCSSVPKNPVSRPLIMVVIDETILNKKSKLGQTVTENAIVAKFIEFDFVNKNQFIQVIASEGKKIKRIYNDSDVEKKALEVASELSAELLLIGQTDVVDGGTILEGYNMKSVQTTLGLKIIDVSTNQLIAANNVSATVPHINFNVGVQASIAKAVEKIYPSIRKQIESKWKN